MSLSRRGLLKGLLGGAGAAAAVAVLPDLSSITRLSLAEPGTQRYIPPSFDSSFDFSFCCTSPTDGIVVGDFSKYVVRDRDGLVVI